MHQSTRRALPTIVLALLASGGRAAALDVQLPEGKALAVTRSVRVAPGQYLRPAPESGAVIVAEGLEDATLDLRGVELRAREKLGDRTAARGIALLLRDCRGVRVIGGSFAGYRIGVSAVDCEELVLEGVECEALLAPRLCSTPVAPCEDDHMGRGESGDPRWIDLHGAAIALQGCSGVEVRDCRARRGSLGLVLADTRASLVYDNDFSFLSGFGIALWNSSGNVIARNRVEFCARGMASGAWTGGLGSCGILLAGNAADNRVEENSAVRSGTGIAVVGAQEGGRNRIARNDVSWSIDDGIELCGSIDDHVLENTALGAGRNGLSARDCTRLTIAFNCLEGARGASAWIADNRDLVLAQNLLRKSARGLELIGSEDAARGSFMHDNAFGENATDVVLERVKGLRIGENVYAPQTSSLLVRNSGERAVDPDEVRARLRGVGGFLPSGRAIDCEFAPFDPTQADRGGELEEAAELPGRTAPCAESARLERVGIVFGPYGPWDPQSREPRPAERPAGGVLARARWDASWFSWRDGPDPRAEGVSLARWRSLADQPLLRGVVSVWNGPAPEDTTDLGVEHFGLVAKTRVALDAGGYRMSVQSDDGMRVSIDGMVVLENWTWHGPTLDQVDFEVEAGEHELVLEYFQVDGGMALTVELDALDL